MHFLMWNFVPPHNNSLALSGPSIIFEVLDIMLALVFCFTKKREIFFILQNCVSSCIIYEKNTFTISASLNIHFKMKKIYNNEL